MAFKRNLLLRTAKLAPDLWAVRLHQPVFVIGCARSGTTVLSEWLDRHADVANLSEANDIWDPSGYPYAKSQNGRKSPPIWIDPDSYTARWWQDNQGRQTEIRSIFAVYQTFKRARVFVNKSPMNTFRIPYLLKMFPDARFIHVVRDGRAVAFSYAQKQYKDMQPEIEVYRQLGIDYSFDELLLKLATHWKEAIEEVQRQDEHFHLKASNRLLEVTYEALCDHTNDVLYEMSDFMGLKSDRYQTAEHKIVMKNQNSKWAATLSDSMAKTVVSIEEPALRQWGYIS